MTNDKNIYSRAAFAAVEYGEEKEYWLNKFSGELKKTAFPYDHKQSPTFKRREETVTLKFSGKTSAKITQLSKGKDYRFHMTLAAGVVALLFRYTGENDIIIGSPVYKQEVEGEFINTILGLRNPVDDRVSFKELLLERIRPSILEANENQNYPVETLLNHLHITNPGTGFPLFDVAVLFESIHDKKYILHTEPGIIFSFSRVPDDGNDGDIVEVRVHYNSALYEPDTARRIARHYRNLMDTAVFNADTPVSRIDILSEAEKQQLLTDFNDTRRDYPSDKTIHDYFQTQASRVPNRTALTYEREPMTYEELDDESNALAAYLRSIGVETGEPVALMIEDSARGVVALLGILKAGAAYVPVNVAYPVERKKYILKDCNIKRLLINIEDPGEYDPSITVISMDDDEIYHFPVQATESAAVSGSQGSHSLAYIMYTSGSTGTPKGVMVEHRSVLRLVKNNGYFEFNEGDSILLTGALEFDASTFEIWGSLLNGLTLHMVSKATIIHHEKLKQAISLGEVTTMWMTSALFNQVLDADIKLFEGLKHLLVGGDVLSPLHINRLRKRFPGLTVINGYGPTENTTFSTTFTINRDYEQGIPIGKPIGNSTAYILDSHYQPVPIGVSGQLYVGGDGLSRGYLNKPQLTAEKFIDKSFTGGTGGQFFKSAPLSAGGRLYATGDLARWLEDGNIEFLGRIDHQVKIRGYRIEPGEVENCLMASGSIREAVVTDRVTRDGEKYLCAYVVPGNGGVSHFDGQQLRSLLSVRLPDYMVPSYFVPLEKIPLTVNGKVNRGALPEPEISGIGPAYKAPRNPMEEKIAETWSDVLKLEKEKIGIDADFFQMGGHSLNATMMTSRLHKAFHAKIPLVELFKNPTIRELAGYITGLETPGDHFDSISPVEQREYYPLSSAQKRVYVLHQMESGTTGYNIPMIMVLKGGPDRSRLRETFGALIRRHESLRTSFMTVNEIPAQRIHDSVEFEVGNKESGVDSKESNEEIINRFIRPFDLSQAPLMRAELVNTGDREHLFMIDMHHIITDGPSMELLVDEFLHAYARNPLPPLHLQYKDYTRWQNSKERQDAIRHQEDYWLKQFEGEPPVLELPHDYPRPTSRSFDGGDVTFELSPSDTRGLNRLALENGATLFMVMMAVYNVLLNKISGQEDIVVGIPGASRRHADLENIIGMFVNALALRSQPEGIKTFPGFLQEVKSGSLKAFENQDYPFEDLVERVALKRDTGRNPVFDAMFGLQNMARDRLTVDDLTLRPYDMGSDIAKFDLTLVGIENGDRLTFTHTYYAKLFKRETVERFTGYFKQIVSAVLTGPAVTLAEIDILPEEEKRQLLYEFNDTETDYPRQKTMHQLFEEQVERTPGAVAIEESLHAPPVRRSPETTYSQLNSSANQLAHLLREKGAGTAPTPFAAVLMNRSVQMITAVLAIVKAGGAYVPIETYLPEARVSFIMSSLNIQWIVTDSFQLQRFSTLLGETTDLKHIICLDSEIPGETVSSYREQWQTKSFIFPHDIQSRSDSNPSPLAGAEDTAYVIFTSGSTGTPKGVTVVHRPVINLIQWVNNTFGIGETDKLLFVASLGFDLSVYDIFGILSSGASLRIATAEDIKNPQHLLEIIFDEGITFWDSAPALLQQLAPYFPAAAHDKHKSRMNLILLSGDWVPVTLPDILKETFDRVRVIACGGATEATVWSNFFPVHEVHPSWPSIPYGKPIQNASYYILDPWMNPRPIGTAGDLYIGGQCLASGYINDILLTHGKFPGNPFAPGKIYKTGDMARWFADGNMEFLGRLDNQVKVRGFRIELGEIESQLLNHHGVKDAVASVTGVKDVKGAAAGSADKHLAAYVVPHPETAYPVLQWLNMERQGMLTGRQHYELPNRMPILYLNRSETDFMYREIFEEHSYTRHQIALEDGACVMDIGANVGMFSLFIHQSCKNPRIYAVEPIPPICELLRLNTSVYGVDAEIFECGLGSQSGEAEFTYYHHVAILSGRFADIAEEKEAVKKYMLGRETGTDGLGDLTEDQMSEMLEDRLASTTFTRPIKTLSQIIRENEIQHIDLLKIDVEKSESEVLQGIHEDDWPRIRQLVVEVHDSDGRLGGIVQLLKRHRYEITVDQEEGLGNTKFYNIFAKLPEAGGQLNAPHPPAYMSAPHLISDMRDILEQKLPGYMIPQYFILLDRLPLTPNGKVDRRALPEPMLEGKDHYTAPTSEIQTQLAALWAEALGNTDPQSVGIDDNFFKMGGHSLKATILAAKIHKTFQVKIPLVDIFRLPDIRGLSHYIESAAKKEHPVIPKAGEMNDYPLSSAQKRLYLLYRLSPEEIVYNMPVAVKLEGETGKEKLDLTFKRLIARHPSLRTSFHMRGEEPVQRIHDQVDFNIEYNDLTGNEFSRNPDLSGEEQNQAMTRDFIRPFQLIQAPLIRVRVNRIGEKEHLLILDMHHIVSDGSSMAVFINDFMSFYGGQEPPPPALRYHDFSQWQNNRRESGAIKKQEAFWLNEFDDEIPLLDLPTDFPRPVVRSYEGRTLDFEIGPGETQQLKALVLEEGATLFIVLLTLYNILLSSLSNQEEIIVGTPSAGRVSDDLREVIGMFVNTIAIKNLPEGHKTFRRFLEEVKSKTFSVFENQEYQFEELVERLPLNRDTSRHPLFCAVLDVQNIDLKEISIKGLKLSPIDHYSGMTKFDLVFHCRETHGTLAFYAEYGSKLFQEESIRRFSHYFKRIISHVLRDRDVVIGEIGILSAQERREIIERLNGSQSLDTSTATLHQLFEEQVERFPHNIALTEPKPGESSGNVSQAPRQMTYRELNGKSNQIASMLQKKGVTPGSIVGIMMDPSVEMIASILGTLKTGAAYMPIDPTYPQQRVKFMLDDADSKILLTKADAMENFSFTAVQGLGLASVQQPTCHMNTPRPPITDFEAQPLVDRTLVDYDKYSPYIGQTMVKQAMSLQATRGCPYKCAYCHEIMSKRHHTRSEESIFREVKQFYDLGVRRFAFIDDIFNLNIKGSQRFFKMILDHKMKCQFFFPNGLRGDILSPGYIDLMVEAGTVGVALALETASPRLQKLIGKFLKPERLRRSLEHLCEKYPHVILELFNMHGFPTETEEEAMMTIDFIKSLKWLHFPYFHILKIFPFTKMAYLAIDHGILGKTIDQSSNLAFHQLPDTLPFPKSFTHQCQADILNQYFLNKERLLHVMPHQMKILTEDEMVQKYNSYLPVEIKDFTGLLDFMNIKKEELDLAPLYDKESRPAHIPDLHRRISQAIPTTRKTPETNAMKILLLDVSQFFSRDSRGMLYDVVEPPLGLMCLLTALNNRFGGKIDGKIAKSRIDFDNFGQLKELLEDFRPDLIGLRTLTYYKDFYHQISAMIRQWGIDTPIVGGGPYAGSDYLSLLRDKYVDFVVINEGEITLCELVDKMLRNNKKLPPQDVMRQIPGLAYMVRENAPSHTFGREILMVESMTTLAREPKQNPALRPPTAASAPSHVNPAYVIYTSGTTGKPKGVLVSHPNVTGLMKTGETLFNYDHRDVWSMFHSFCFDFSVWEMYGALLYGGRLILPSRMLNRDTHRYLQMLKRETATILNHTPTVFYQLADEETLLETEELQVRFVIFGGEALKPGKLRMWHDKYPNTRLINMYGITETTVHVTFKEITGAEIDSNISNIGVPIASLSGLIVNKHLRLQPNGVSGELLVAGQGVAPGYLNRPRLTAGKFLSIDPPGTQSPRNVYRSGDLVRLNREGEMEYLGRIDHQVKIRGNRVETGEVERQLLLLGTVEEVIVMAREDDKGNNYLCAYMVMVPGREVTVSELRESLKQKLPEYMIPSYFIQMDQLPVTSTGKVNRNKLPLPSGHRPELGTAYAEPETDTARTVAGVWRDVLELDKVGIHDNFFDLGGSSMELVRLNTRLQEELSIDIPIATFFEYPTIHTFTQNIDRAESMEAVPVEENESEKDSAISSRLQKGRGKMKGRRKRIQ